MKVALVNVVMVLLGIGAHQLLQQVKKSYCMFMKKNTVFSFWLESTTSRDASSLTSIENYTQQQEC